MKLLAHRGLWYPQHEKNSLQALTDSITIGVGMETDIRDCDGTLIVSHDPPRKADALHLDTLLQIYSKHSTKPVLALNIKSDGLHVPLYDLLKKYEVENYFVFDMSIPDTLGYQRMDMPFAARISEYESNNTVAKFAPWIWLDGFHNEWFDISLIQSWLDLGKRVAIVSSELHHRPHLPLWHKLTSLHDQSQVYLCTDFVKDAVEFFDANKN